MEGSRLDHRYSLALYLSQYALVSHNIHVLQEDVAKHDMKSLKVLKLVKSVAKVPTYLITFEAPLCAEIERKNVETFETEIYMPTLNVKCSVFFPVINKSEHTMEIKDSGVSCVM
ncbi:hypothetical protein POM88_025206 [Heracleum sosnowskyi]|uniref:Uncharacterized protein n=1 Tax=Heracleum sosnowskyi TaxID=360622 RepID=A0AAD8I5Q4_9APIA|nr:hypothetical protein POM88_025206 [Heracleum sosnowskyi]